MREFSITCADGAALGRVDKRAKATQLRIEKAKTPAELREICKELCSRLRVSERYAVQTASRIAVMKGEIRKLAKSRERLQCAVKVLAAQVSRNSPEAAADGIAAMYDPKAIPF